MADSDARDLLEQDMARHEREHGAGEVHALRNQTLAAEALAMADQMYAEPARQVSAPPVVVTDSVERRELNGHTYVIDRSVNVNEDVAFRRTTEFEKNVLAHAQPRIQLLLSKQDEGPFGTPSWRTKTLAALYFKIKSLEATQSGRPGEAAAFDRAFQQDLYELLEASNQPFGDWRKSAPTKIVIASR